MGYTHYWVPSQGHFPDNFLSGVRKIIETTSIPLLLEYDLPGTQPQISSEEIRFNGVGEDGHETFYWKAGDSWTFRKTARKPYDEVVTAILALGSYYNLCEVESDGIAKEWQAGIDLAQMATGLPVVCPLSHR